MDILNTEFACNHEILILPKNYGNLNSEFFIAERSNCTNFSLCQYVHFTAKGKPWYKIKNKMFKPSYAL
jgi:hypothetical protein